MLLLRLLPAVLLPRPRSSSSSTSIRLSSSLSDSDTSSTVSVILPLNLLRCVATNSFIASSKRGETHSQKSRLCSILLDLPLLRSTETPRSRLGLLYSPSRNSNASSTSLERAESMVSLAPKATRPSAAVTRARRRAGVTNRCTMPSPMVRRMPGCGSWRNPRDAPSDARWQHPRRVLRGV